MSNKIVVVFHSEQKKRRKIETGCCALTSGHYWGVPSESLFIGCLVLLLAEVAALSQTCLTTGGSAKDHVASSADGGDLGV